MLNQQKASKAQIFGLPAPTREGAIKNLSRVLGESDASKLWLKICHANAIDPKSNELPDLEVVFKELSLIDGSVGVCGKSLMVIAMTFRNLNQV